MPAFAAYSATGLGPTARPRPAAASGRVSTATTSCLDRSSSSREGTAVCGVPAKTSRITSEGAGSGGRPRSERLAPGGMRGNLHLRRGLTPPVGLADLLHRQLALHRVQPVDEQHAVQVVGLVLDAPCELPGPLQD